MSPDWSTQCEAISRKTNLRCTHKSSFLIPNILAFEPRADIHYAAYGRPVYLCNGHANHWWARRKRLLTVKLIDGGYLSAYNRHAYGSIVTSCERILFGDESQKIIIPQAWGLVEVRGKLPSEVAERLHYK